MPANVYEPSLSHFKVKNKVLKSEKQRAEQDFDIEGTSSRPYHSLVVFSRCKSIDVFLVYRMMSGVL